MMKEYQVPQEIASRVVTYFTEGAKDCGLLGADGVLADPNSGVALATDFPIVAPNPRDRPDRRHRCRQNIGSLLQ